MNPTVENQFLTTENIISSTGEINKDKINLIAGVCTPPFAEMVWTVTGGETETVSRIYNVLNDLYRAGRETEMLEVLRLLFPEDVELLTEHPEARSYFLFSFLLDYDDVIEDCKAGQRDGF